MKLISVENTGGKMKKELAGVALAALLSACASSSILVGAARPAISPDQVKLYLDPPSAPYEKVALVDAGSKHSWTISDRGKTNKVVERLKKEAAALGANGLLLSAVADQQIGAAGIGQVSAYGSTAYGIGIQGGVFQKKGQALAIYVMQADIPNGSRSPTRYATPDAIQRPYPVKQDALEAGYSPTEIHSSTMGPAVRAQLVSDKLRCGPVKHDITTGRSLFTAECPSGSQIIIDCSVAACTSTVK